MSDRIRILIADDHEVVRRGLSLVLRQEQDLEVVAEAQDGQKAVTKTIDIAPDLVLLDWKMPNMDGLQAAQSIKEQNPSVRTLMLSGAPVESDVLDALDNGIDGHVHKDTSPSVLVHAIRVVAGGKTYLGPEITQALLEQSRKPNRAIEPPSPTLSNREIEVLKLMATPATYRQIGEQLYISEETVRTYAKRIFTKLDQPNRTQAVIAALRLDLIEIN